MNKSTCIIDGCERQRRKREWCRSHYESLRVKGEIPPKPCKGCGEPLPGNRHYCSEACKPRCEVVGCGDVRFARQWCQFHYTRWKITGDPAAPLSRQQYAGGQTCSFDGCDGAARKVGLCVSHYSQTRRGVPLTPLVKWADDFKCLFCGRDTVEGSGMRRYCSVNCQQLYYKHGSDLPESWECTRCGKAFSYIVEGKRRIRADRKACHDCTRATSKHGTSPAEIARRDGSDCKLCGDPIDMDLRKPDYMCASVDHILPRSLGGTNDLENLQLAHLVCNIRKGNRIDVAV